MPGKNIRMLSGKPLIAWSIEQAKAVSRIDRVIVSTDSEEIASVALNYGAEVPFLRPAELSGDTSPEWLAWRHLLHFLEQNYGGLPDIMVSIPATAPLRLPVDIDRCIDDFISNEVDIVITVSDSHRNPWFNMVKYKPDNSVELVMSPPAPISRRQDAPVVYDISTVAYVASPQFVLDKNGIFGGRVRAVKVPVERAVDIDNLLDFEFAEFLLSRRM